jgi:sulfur-oxidizing protein SoxA
MRNISAAVTAAAVVGLAIASVAASTPLGPVAAAAPGPAASDPRRGGADFMTPALQAMQADDQANPALLWVADGGALWQARAGAAQKSCADCHGEIATAMRGVAARYPAFDALAAQPITLPRRIALCRERYQGVAVDARRPPGQISSNDADPALALEAAIAIESRGQPIAPPTDPRLHTWRERGRALYGQRIGQLNLSCSQCHDANAGQRLGGSMIPQAHPTGYPLYRLEWQALGGLARRIRACMVGVRAQPFADDSPEQTALVLFLMQRAAGMAIDAPGLRP